VGSVFSVEVNGYEIEPGAYLRLAAPIGIDLADAADGHDPNAVTDGVGAMRAYQISSPYN
jgi:hypothetical protein